MLREFEYSIDGVDDFELNIKREHKLNYYITSPTKKSDGLVFVVAGFGNDSSIEYSKKLREYIANEYNLTAVTVIYHCFHSRFSNGATLKFIDEDIELLNFKLSMMNLEEFSGDIGKSLTKLNSKIYKAKSSRAYPIDRVELLTAQIVPKYNEYQNFGVMQAIDHLYVLGDILKRGEIEFNRGNIIAFGSSHGGFIANLISKIAPNTLSAVFDNSSYSYPNLRYICGRELNPKLSEFRVNRPFGFENFALDGFIKSYWTLDKSSPYYLSKGRLAIRSMIEKSHIDSMAEISNSKTQYRFFHSKFDKIATIEDKELAVSNLRDSNFDVELKVIESKSDIDGKFIKSLSHGMELSLKKMFDFFYLTVKKRDESLDFDLSSEIEYRCEEFAYKFKFSSDDFTIKSNCKRVEF